MPGIGRITGTCWSFTDFVFGAPPLGGSNPAHVCDVRLPCIWETSGH